MSTAAGSPGNCSRADDLHAHDPPSHGLECCDPGSNNRIMKIKATQLYGWDSEPVDERPSEFMSSTGCSTVSGYYSTAQATRQPPRRSRLAFASLILVVLTVLAVGTLALASLASLLHR